MPPAKRYIDKTVECRSAEFPLKLLIDSSRNKPRHEEGVGRDCNLRLERKQTNIVQRTFFSLSGFRKVVCVRAFPHRIKVGYIHFSLSFCWPLKTEWDRKDASSIKMHLPFRVHKTSRKVFSEKKYLKKFLFSLKDPSHRLNYSSVNALSQCKCIISASHAVHSHFSATFSRASWSSRCFRPAG